MIISSDDMMELRRIAANTYEQDKCEQIYRIINGIAKLERLVSQLKSENDKLKISSNNTTTWQCEVDYRLIL